MSQSTAVPFVDLVSMHQQLSDELLAVCKRVIETAGFVGGPEVEGLEKEFASFCGADYCVGVNSGTDALRFALMAAGIPAGSIALTVPNTFIATTEAISQAGALIGFIDVDADTLNMSPEKLRNYLESECELDAVSGQCMHTASGRQVSAVVPVHLFGQMADMDLIMELAEKYNLIVIEDACQAHGAEYFSKKQNRWLKAGTVGLAAAFSFYPGKNLGACGEGGAITTNDQELARKCTIIREHGSIKKYFHDVEGYNGRLDSIQAGILRVKLKHLADWNEQRRQSAQIYGELLDGMRGSINAPIEPNYSKSVYHLYVIRTPFRDELQTYLGKAGIGTGIHYPVPVHLQKAYEGMGWKKGDFPEAEEAASQILSLPMFGGLTADQQKLVTETIAQFAATCAVR